MRTLTAIALQTGDTVSVPAAPNMKAAWKLVIRPMDLIVGMDERPDAAAADGRGAPTRAQFEALARARALEAVRPRAAGLGPNMLDVILYGAGGAGGGGAHYFGGANWKFGLVIHFFLVLLKEMNHVVEGRSAPPTKDSL